MMRRLPSGGFGAIIVTFPANQVLELSIPAPGIEDLSNFILLISVDLDWWWWWNNSSWNAVWTERFKEVDVEDRMYEAERSGKVELEGVRSVGL